MLKALSDITFAIKSAFDSKSAFRYHFWMKKCKVGAFGNGKHSDLWLEVVRLVEVIDLKHIRVIKVPAHEDITTATTSFDEWICVANSVADRAAKAANRNRVGNFWTLWEHHVGQSLKMRFLGVQIRDHIAAVNMRWVSRFKDREPSVVLPVLVGKEFATHIAEWMGTWVDSSPQARLQWISFAQLFILYQLDIGSIPVVKQGKRWVVVSQSQFLLPERFSFRQLLKWFRLLLQNVLKDLGATFQTATLRPESLKLQCHIGCISVCLNQAKFHQIESWLNTSCVYPVTGLGQDLDKLPLANMASGD